MLRSRFLISEIPQKAVDLQNLSEPAAAPPATTPALPSSPIGPLWVSDLLLLHSLLQLYPFLQPIGEQQRGGKEQRSAVNISGAAMGEPGEAIAHNDEAARYISFICRRTH